MKRFLIPNRKVGTVLLIVAFLVRTTVPVYAKSPVKMNDFAGTIDFNPTGVTRFTLDGTASHLGRFHADGEVEFAPGAEAGTLVGHGAAVFEAANGDLLVADVTWEVEAGGDFRTSAIHFSWRDFVKLADGSVVANTGHFVTNRPPGLVVIAIIAILIGLLVPAI